MSSGHLEEVQEQLQRFQHALEKLEHLIEDDTISLADQGHVHHAQRHLATSQVVHHAFTLYLRAQGRASKEHPIHKETERLKFYSKKVRKLESAEYLSHIKPSMEVDVPAANRFITHAIPDLSKDQKAAIRKVGQKRKVSTLDAVPDAASKARTFLAETFGSK